MHLHEVFADVLPVEHLLVVVVDEGAHRDTANVGQVAKEAPDVWRRVLNLAVAVITEKLKQLLSFCFKGIRRVQHHEAE